MRHEKKGVKRRRLVSQRWRRRFATEVCPFFPIHWQPRSDEPVGQEEDSISTIDPASWAMTFVSSMCIPPVSHFSLSVWTSFQRNQAYQCRSRLLLVYYHNSRNAPLASIQAHLTCISLLNISCTKVNFLAWSVHNSSVRDETRRDSWAADVIYFGCRILFDPIICFFFVRFAESMSYEFGEIYSDLPVAQRTGRFLHHMCSSGSISCARDVNKRQVE